MSKAFLITLRWVLETLKEGTAVDVVKLLIEDPLVLCVVDLKMAIRRDFRSAEYLVERHSDKLTSCLDWAEISPEEIGRRMLSSCRNGEKGRLAILNSHQNQWPRCPFLDKVTISYAAP